LIIVVQGKISKQILTAAGCHNLLESLWINMVLKSLESQTETEEERPGWKVTGLKISAN